MQEIIYNFLKAKGLSPFAIAGIMGNIYAESRFVSTAIDGYGDDAGYTKSVDEGINQNFMRDNIPYGLMQWQAWTDKEALEKRAKAQNKSIGDLEVQLEFLWSQIQAKVGVMRGLKTADSTTRASDLIYLQYKNPFDKNDRAKNLRREYADIYYKQYAEKPKEEYAQEASWLSGWFDKYNKLLK